MSNKIILPFDDKEEGIYELSIDLDVLSKDGILNAIKGIGRTGKKNQRSTSADNDLSRLPEIFDDIARQTDRKNPLSAILSKIFKKKDKNIEGKMPSPQDRREKPINCGEGHDTYTTKSPRRARGLNPFVPPLNEIEPSAIEDKILDLFKGEVVETKNVSELKDIVDQALYFGIRTNACHEGQQSFADCVMRKILSGQLEGDNQKDKPEDIIRELILKGAMFSYDLLQDKRISETCNKLRQEVQPQVDKRLKKLKEVGNSAVQGGRVEDVGIDNKTFFMKFSEGSTVEPAKILEGTRELGLDKGCIELGGHILKMGDSEVEIRVEEGGKRNYVDVLDGSNLAMTLRSSLGMLEIRLHHDTEDYDQVQVRVENQEMWAELQKRGEIVGKGCLFGGMTIKEAIERGSFMRCGMWSKEQATEEIKAVSNNGPSETISWVDKTSKSSNSQENSRG